MLVENVRAFVAAVQKAKPSGSKGAYMTKISLSSTMGASVTIDTAAANAR
jgi:large subunit ribosomal protein L1